MTPRSLFNIVLKIFGLFFLKEIIYTIPQLISSLLYFTKANTAEEGLWTFLLTAVVLAFYTFLVFQLLFKTNFYIKKLKLDRGFDQQDFSVNISTSSILTIALIVIGGLLLVNEIPNFCRQIFAYFQEKRLTNGMTKPDFSFAIITGVKIVLGLLIIGERKRIVEFTESRQKGEIGRISRQESAVNSRAYAELQYSQ